MTIISTSIPLIYDILMSLIIGVASSTIFVLVILRILKPKIKISDKVCFDYDSNKKKFFFFKVVNESIFDAYSCEFVLHRRVPYIIDKSKINHKLKKIELSKISIISLPRYKKEKGYGDHAFLIRTFEDLSNDIDEKNLDYLLSVSVKHGLSNLTKVTQKYFVDSEVFHEGEFKFGSNTDVC